MQSPCPHRIVDDMGYAFLMGSIGGSVWYGVKGYRNAPRGFLYRLKGSGKSIASRAPVLGGNFAVWGLCFSSFDCVFLHWRRKDDALNAIAAGAATGGVLAWRAGIKAMTISALIGGTFLAVIEGLGLMLSKTFGGDQHQQGPMSPYSTSYSPVGPGRHVGNLDAPPQTIDSSTENENEFSNDNLQSWNINNELGEDITFDHFGERNETFDSKEFQNTFISTAHDHDSQLYEGFDSSATESITFGSSNS